MTEKKALVTPKAIHAIIGMAIMFLFPLLPISLPEVTPLGMKIIGIFLGTLYLWTTGSNLCGPALPASSWSASPDTVR